MLFDDPGDTANAEALGALFTALAVAASDTEYERLLVQGIQSITRSEMSDRTLRDDRDGSWRVIQYRNGNHHSLVPEPALASVLEALCAQVVDGGMTQIGDDPYNAPISPHLELCRLLGAPSLKAFPIASDGKCYGIILADGSAIDFELDGVRTLIGTLADYVSALATTRRRLQSIEISERHFHALYNTTPVMMQAIDKDGRLISVSDHWLKVLGYEREEVIGQNVGGFLAEQSRRLALQVNIPLIMEGGIPQVVEYTWVKKNGETVDVLLSAVSDRDSEGKISGAHAVLMDITERKQTEARIRELETEMNHISRLSAMGEMASGLAHELNQPLTAMINFVQASRRTLQSVDTPMPEEVYEDMDDAVEQAVRAGEIIHRLRDFVKRGETEQSWEDLGGVVKNASAMALVDATDLGIFVVYDIAEFCRLF